MLFFDIFEEEWDKTSEIHKKDCVYWTEFYNHWIDLIRSIISQVPEEKQYQSLTAIRFLELNRDILWGLFSSMVGSYETAIRELRFWLEAILQAHLVDARGGIQKLSRGVECLVGAKLIRTCGFPEQFSSRLLKLYKDLCKYVHPTKEELNLDCPDARITFTYEKSSFLRNLELTKRTYDAILYIVMTTFHEASKDYAQKTLVLQSLEMMNYELTLRYLEEIGITSKT